MYYRASIAKASKPFEFKWSKNSILCKEDEARDNPQVVQGPVKALTQWSGV